MYSTDRITDTLATTKSRRSILKTLVGAGAAVALVPTLGLLSPVAARSTDSRIVNTEGARLRSGPGTAYSIVATLAKGTEVRYLAYGGSANGYEWHKVQVLATGKQGFIASSLLSMPGGSSSPVISGIGWTTSAVNLRSGPGTSYAVLRVVPYGAQVGTSTTVTNGFRYVSHNGLAGWMASAYITTTNPDDQSGNYATTTANVNFRTEPSTSSAIIQVIPAGARVQVLHTQAGDFINVNYNTRQGWVHKAYLRF